MNRRDFLKQTAISTAALALADRLSGAQTADSKPNVVYVFSDTHRWASMPFTEAPDVHAPNMLALKSQGVTFDHCYSNLPICTPYRAIMQTGRWPFQTGFIENHLDLHYRVDGSMQTIGSVFRAAGYRTEYYGKWHLGPADGQSWGYDVFNSGGEGAGEGAQGCAHENPVIIHALGYECGHDRDQHTEGGNEIPPARACGRAEHFQAHNEQARGHDVAQRCRDFERAHGRPPCRLLNIASMRSVTR